MNLSYSHGGGVLRDSSNNILFDPYNTANFENEKSKLANFESSDWSKNLHQTSRPPQWQSDPPEKKSEDFNKAPGAPVRHRTAGCSPL